MTHGTDRRLSTRRYQKFRLEMLERDRFQCQIGLAGCTHWADTLDHIIPRALGGALMDPANVRAACAYCNRWRGVGEERMTPITPRSPFFSGHQKMKRPLSNLSLQQRKASKATESATRTPESHGNRENMAAADATGGVILSGDYTRRGGADGPRQA